MRTSGLAAALIAVVIASFGTSEAHAATPARSTRVSVVAAFYPLAYVAARVGGSRVEVSDLTPGGSEPHDLELTTTRRDAIETADLVIVMGHGFQPAIEDAAGARSHGTVKVLDALPIDAGRKRAVDPHVWLDPVLMQDIVALEARALSKVDAQRRAAYTSRADRLRRELASLDADYRAGLANCDRTLLVTSHEAFGWLAARYGLQQRGIAGFSPENEPDPRQFAELSDLARRKHVTTIFTESLVSPKIAETLAREAGGLRTDVLNPIEGLTDRQRRAGDDYFTLMRANLRKLRRALGCP
ncbi:MAG: zinc ABC transporter substrate-binding protein [Actinobacteria bacterium]|nr:MAG: zinc ABC transporter substrate-binding protein [Actinomycetota bacterium]